MSAWLMRIAARGMPFVAVVVGALALTLYGYALSVDAATRGPFVFLCLSGTVCVLSGVCNIARARRRR